jgi:hypothetical protein
LLNASSYFLPLSRICWAICGSAVSFIVSSRVLRLCRLSTLLPDSSESPGAQGTPLVKVLNDASKWMPRTSRCQSETHGRVSVIKLISALSARPMSEMCASTPISLDHQISVPIASP